MKKLTSAGAAYSIALLFALFACSSDHTVPIDPDPDPQEPEEPENPGSIPAGFTLALTEVARDLDNPLFLTAPRNDDRLFVVEKTGRIKIIKDGIVQPVPFLDIRSKTVAVNERGLLGMAFHPDYATNGWFFVNYTDLSGDTRVERYTASAANPDVAVAGSAALVLFIEQPAENHNGGMLAFGPDGMLYVGMGDGGTGGAESQNKATLLGDMLRIDVDALPYSVPTDNPFVGQSGVRPEIWATGLRNPWRYSIDHAASRIYIGDVGQVRREEITVLSLSAGGANLGWSSMEGTLCHDAPNCSAAGTTAPATEYGRDDGCAVIGGFVYRGDAIPEVRGRYFYSDLCSGWLRSFLFTDAQATELRNWNIPGIGHVVSFGEDGHGELYMMSGFGIVYRIVKGTQ